MKFTDTYIKNLKILDHRYEKYGGGGLGICVNTNKDMAWFYRYKCAGITQKITIGYYPKLTLAQAQAKHLVLRQLLKSGVDPREHLVEEKRKGVTVGKFIEEWYENYILEHRKRPEQIDQIIKADITPLLGSKELKKLQAIEITEALDKIVKRGSRVHANKVLGALKQAFSYAVSRGALDINPAISIRAKNIGGIEKPRDRYLTMPEIKKLWLFLDSSEHRLSIQVKNAIKIILLTGIRSGELRLAEFSEIDYSNSLWTIPAEHTKTNITMKIHLADFTKGLFLELKNHSNSKFFLSGKNGDVLTDKALSRAIRRIQERVGIPHWTAHDLRRSFATQLSETMVIDPVVVEKCLGHKMPKIMATYNKNEMLPQRREALEKWAKYIENLTIDNVISINDRKLA